MRDVSEREQLLRQTREQELRLIQASRMTTLGQLAAGIAHQVKNPSHVILQDARSYERFWPGVLQRLDATVRDPATDTIAGLPYATVRASLPAMTAQIIQATQSVTEIVDELQSYVRPGPPKPAAPFDVNDAIRRSLVLLEHLIRQHTERFAVEYAPSLPRPTGDPFGFGQVLVNVVINALEALPERRCAVIVRTGVEAGCVTVTVDDEGIGIPAENLGRIGEPFVTTKADRGGTGLGLALGIRILKSFDATLQFERRPTRGTRAIIRFAATGPLGEPA